MFFREIKIRVNNPWDLRVILESSRSQWRNTFMEPMGHGWYGAQQPMPQMWGITCGETYWFNGKKKKKKKKLKKDRYQIVNIEGSFYDPHSLTWSLKLVVKSCL